MSDPSPIVYLVDDDTSVLKALGRLLDSAGVRSVAFESPDEFLKRFDPGAGGCLVLDVAMPGLNGLELQHALAEKGSDLPIVFLTGHADVSTSVRAMKRGAVDFLTKPVDEGELLAAIRSGFDRSAELLRARKEIDGVRQRLSTLTPRETQVLEHIVRGRLNKQIAAELGTVEKTIKVHRGHVMHKMGVRTVAELVRLAGRVGISVGELQC
jgi:FixJ family two-component response regulator